MVKNNTWFVGVVVTILMVAAIVLDKEDLAVIEPPIDWYESVEESDSTVKMLVDIGGTPAVEKYIVQAATTVPNGLCREGLYGYKVVTGSQLSSLIIQGNAVVLCSEFKQAVPNECLYYTYYGTDLDTGLMYFGTENYYDVYPEKRPEKF